MKNGARKNSISAERTLLKRISIHPDYCGGRPRVKGHRIPVEHVLELLGAGITSRRICRDWYPTLRVLVRNEEVLFSEELLARR